MASTHSRIGQVLSEESFLLSLQEAEDNLLHITLGSFNNLPSASQKNKISEKTEEDNPVLALLYDNLLPILRTGVLPEAPTITISTEKCKSAENLISLLEVAEHDSMDDCWIVLYDRVYDITKFLNSVSHSVSNEIQIHRGTADKSLFLCVFQSNSAPGRLRCHYGTRGSRRHFCLQRNRPQR